MGRSGLPHVDALAGLCCPVSLLQGSRRPPALTVACCSVDCGGVTLSWSMGLGGLGAVCAVVGWVHCVCPREPSLSLDSPFLLQCRKNDDGDATVVVEKDHFMDDFFHQVRVI